jgi:hypothetical protein
MDNTIKNHENHNAAWHDTAIPVPLALLLLHIFLHSYDMTVCMYIQSMYIMYTHIMQRKLTEMK